ncbi:MAG: phosphotransferase [Desulfobulbaceae bacterium]|nr:phosphotransferase [Desulfobulbaceae bacterium]
MDEIIIKAGKLLNLSEKRWNPDQVCLQPISPDGSQRRFHRLIGPDGERVLVIQPPAEDKSGLQEAEAAFHIGRHLYELSIPVPEVYGFEQDSGRLFVEDLGDQRLYDLLQDAADEQRLKWYSQVVVELVRMQVHGSRDFSASWCWDTPCYDRQLMLERESGYFLQALCRDFLDLSFDHEKIKSECLLLAERASRAPADFFLHRDFQSRNIMIKEGKVRIIDFQGGRRGPLAYDLASLLIDPYIALSESLQHEIRQVYLARLQEYIPYDSSQFEQEYMLLALQRNLQILGAFAFLSRKRKKHFFSSFIEPALGSLNSLLAKPEAADYAGLRDLAYQCYILVDRP